MNQLSNVRSPHYGITFFEVLTASNLKADATGLTVIDSYLSEPLSIRKSDPLQYWKEKEIQWPLLARLTLKYLAVPPASVPSDRLFSTAGDIVCEQRNWINSEKVEMLLFLLKNLKTFKFVY